MKTLGKISRFAGAIAISAALILPASSAFADPGGTAMGAGAGALAGGLITHGSPAGIIGGAVVGGVAGPGITRNHHHYYHHHHRRYCGNHYC